MEQFEQEPIDRPTPLEQANHYTEVSLLYLATAGTVAFAGLAGALGYREATSSPDPDRSAASEVALKGYAIAGAACGYFAVKLKVSVDAYTDRYRRHRTKPGLPG